MRRVSAQGLSKQLPIFWLQKYRSARQSPVKCILGSAARSPKKMYLLSAHVSTLEFAGNGPRWHFKAKQTAAKIFLLSIHKHGRSLFVKMAFQGYTKMANTVKKYISAA
jgi:hypothetical protein